MDASSQSLQALITSAGIRFIIPVYQRPYSWDEEQCEQLWEDVLATGQGGEGTTHFTGSVVWVQQGTMSPSGVTPVLVIDGQQRITTVTLLLIALAEYARAHADEALMFSYEEILGTGYLVNQYKKGDDHYKLMLSQGDRPVLCSLIDHLEDPDAPLDVSRSSRLVRNPALFRGHLEGLADPNAVWRGVLRLQIVSISLDQQRDNPQLIFESMNSTGKDLSSADLIRNFVLMSHGADEQERLYRNHWRVIEETLGEEMYDTVFDEFIRNWLTVLYAPEPLVKRDVYALFKRHVADNGYGQGRVNELLQELERFARYYAAITRGVEQDPALRVRFERIARFRATVANPLLLSFYDDYEHNAFSHEAFVCMLDVLESYLFRRAVCDCATNSLNKFFSSLIARLNKVQDDGGDYCEAFEAFLLNEAGTPRRFPSDAEFSEALLTRDCYGFRRSLYLLSRLENSYHPKDERDFTGGTYTIEHIMPRNAMAHEEWRAMLGAGCDELFEQLVNTLGNLTLTAYNSELSDGTFVQKKERAVGGYEHEYISISTDVRDAQVWDAQSIRARGKRLSARALEVWGFPQLADEVCQAYVPQKKSEVRQRVVKVRDLLNAGLLEAGTRLVPKSETLHMQATVTGSGMLRLANGEEYASPSLAAIHAQIHEKGSSSSCNGWHFWKLEDGRLLDELRCEYLASANAGDSDLALSRVMYWDGFYEYCSSMPEFVEAFDDPAKREANRGAWASFGIGVGGCHPNARIIMARNSIGLDVWCDDVSMYAKLYARKEEFARVAEQLDGTFRADNVDKAVMEDGYVKKTRAMYIARGADFDTADWDELYAWHAEGLLLLRALMLEALGR